MIGFLRHAGARLGSALITLWLAVTVAFFLARLSGDPVRRILGDFATPEQLDDLREQLGLSDPLFVQYFRYLGDLVTLNFGNSLVYNVPNIDLIMARLPYSVSLGALAILIAVSVGIPLGMLAAVYEGKWIDRVASTVALIGQSAPLFWIGMMAILLFAQILNWLPAGQANSPASYILPATTLALLPLAQIARLTRSSMSEVLSSPFVDALRARGLSSGRVQFLHALRNASLPVITIIGLQAGLLLSAAVTIEAVFSWPGLGTLAVNAASARDFSLVQAIVVLGALAFIIINLVIDLLYTVLDPRTRTAG
ncbi:MAG: ABC transporter permease [Microbacterium sp.]